MGLVAWAFVGGALLVALAALVGHALGWQRARRRAAGHLEAARQRDAELESARVGMEARDRVTVAEVERWRCAASDLEASLSDIEQEKTRLDYELRQVGLAASRVPQLEQHVFELGRTEAALAEARRRLGELESVAAELDLRDQYIESLQRALSQRDERVLALEQRVEQLAGPGAPAGGLVPAEPGRLLPAEAWASSRPAPAADAAHPGGASGPDRPAGPAVPVGPAAPAFAADQLVGAGRPVRRHAGADAGGGPGRRPGANGAVGALRAGSIAAPAPAVAARAAASGTSAVPVAPGPAAVSGAPGPPEVAVPPDPTDDDRSDPATAGEAADANGSPPVSRALQQALTGLGVRSFADLGLFDPAPDEER